MLSNVDVYDVNSFCRKEILYNFQVLCFTGRGTLGMNHPVTKNVKFFFFLCKEKYSQLLKFHTIKAKLCLYIIYFIFGRHLKKVLVENIHNLQKLLSSSS